LEATMKNTDDNEALVPLGLDDWEAMAPPQDFVTRVVEKATRPAASNRRRHVGVAAVSALGLLAAGIVATFYFQAPSRGDVRAEIRKEVSLGGHGIAVLEPGAHIRWSGTVVEQDAGEVFYRVNPLRAGTFVVHAPDSVDVAVHGTCFKVNVEEPMNKRDVAMVTAGAAMATAVFVGVYEGKVFASQRGSSVSLSAGEAARADQTGLHSAGSVAEAEVETSRARAEASSSLHQANRSLADQVSEYRKRMTRIEDERAALAGRLAETEEKLKSDGKATGAPKHNAFDLSKDDWAEMAKTGDIKARIPCAPRKLANVTSEQLQKLSLAPDDVPVLQEVYRSTHEWLEARVRPYCLEVIGRADIVDKLGPSQCAHMARDLLTSSDDPGMAEALKQVGEIMAGQRAAPRAGEKVHAIVGMFLPIAQVNGVFEKKLAEHYGPEEAHRLAYAEGMCAGTSHWGGPGRQK
jgi:hypothetical protein